MADVPVENVIMVELDAGETPAPSLAPQAQSPETASPAPAAPDPKAVQVVVIPPGAAAAEVIALKPDLSDAAAVLPLAVQNGYFIHGEGYFDAIQIAVRGRKGRMGGPQWLETVTEEQRGELGSIVARAITAEKNKIAKAVLAVQAKAAELARRRLEESLAEIVTSTIRYISQASDESRAKAWLKVSDLAGGARTIIFNEDAGLDLVQSIFFLRTAFLAFVKQDAALARAMKSAGPEMRQIAFDRWIWLRDKDRENTPGPDVRIPSEEYGVDLMDASNPARPDLVAKAKELFPDPADVTVAREKMQEASAAFTSTMIDEGEVHPILYRIWSPRLADDLFDELRKSGSAPARVKLFQPVSRFRMAISESLRSAYAAANSLQDTIEGDAAVVWKYPLLINAAVDAMGLAEDAHERVVAEHTLVAAAESEEQVQKGFQRTSEVLLVVQLAIRFVPAPQAVPIALVLGAIDLAVGGIALLRQYFADSETRAAFRAFLSPARCFAASDGSYVGIVIGAAFLLFGTLGLKRTTLTVPSKGEIGMAVAGIGVAEYITAPGKAP